MQACKRVLVPPKQPPARTLHGAESSAAAAAEGQHPAAAVREFLGTVVSGGIAGCAMWATVLPVDAAKTRIQAEFKGGRHDAPLATVMRVMWREGGLHCWWGGLAPTLLRAFPANAAQWIAWEAAQRALR